MVQVRIFIRGKVCVGWGGGEWRTSSLVGMPSLRSDSLLNLALGLRFLPKPSFFGYLEIQRFRSTHTYTDCNSEGNEISKHFPK